MTFISFKKAACVLSLLMMSCYIVTGDAADATPAVTAELAPASSPPVTPPVMAPMKPEAEPIAAAVMPVITAPEKPVVAVPETAPPEKPVAATPEPAASEKAVVATPKPGAPEKPIAVIPVTDARPLPVAHAKTEPAVVAPSKLAVEELAKVALNLNSEEQKRAYASGVALGQYIEKQIEQQKALHITLDRDIILAGITDTFKHQEKMSVQDVQATLTAFDEQVKVLTQAAVVKKQEEGKAFINAFAKRPDVKKTAKGLYYQIEEKGEGTAIKDTNQVEVSYRGELIDGTVVDGPQMENSNQIFRVANMPPVLRDSVKLIRKGGRIKVVIPPAVLESNNAAAKQNDVVMIYIISVVNVNNSL